MILSQSNMMVYEDSTDIKFFNVKNGDTRTMCVRSIQSQQ